MSKFILEVNSLKKNYGKDNKKTISIFRNVNFKIKFGELVAITGPSGSGKSTLINILAMLEKPTQGKIFFLGKNLKSYSELEQNKFRQSKVSIIFQNNNLLSDFTSLENIMLPLLIRGEKSSSSILEAKKILKVVNLSERATHFPSQLSGGEQQRVAIARSLITKSDLILADEPTGNLDHNTSLEIFSYFQKLKKLNKTILFATHNRELANRADYKLSILNGGIKRINVTK